MDPSVFVGRIQDSVKDALVRLHVPSAMSPVLIACFIVSLPAMIIAYFATGAIQKALLVLSFIPVSVFAVGYLYFMIRDPDRLQSETFLARSRALDIIQEKGGPIQVVSADINRIANPQFHVLPAAKNQEAARPHEGDDAEGLS